MRGLSLGIMPSASSVVCPWCKGQPTVLPRVKLAWCGACERWVYPKRKGKAER